MSLFCQAAWTLAPGWDLNVGLVLPSSPHGTVLLWPDPQIFFMQINFCIANCCLVILTWPKYAIRSALPFPDLELVQRSNLKRCYIKKNLWVSCVLAKGFQSGCKMFSQWPDSDVPWKLLLLVSYLDLQVLYMWICTHVSRAPNSTRSLVSCLFSVKSLHAVVVSPEMEVGTTSPGW